MIDELKNYLNEIDTDEFYQLDRDEQFFKILDSNCINTHTTFIEAYNFLTSKTIQQSTVSDFFNSNSIKKENGIYRHTQIKSDIDTFNSLFISKYCGRISKISNSNLFYSRIVTEVGTEQSLAKIIYDYIENSNIIIIPCYGCIMLLSPNKSKLKSCLIYIKDCKNS